MSKFEWNESMSVAVEVIDKDHEYLASILNDLSDALQKGKGHEMLEGCLENTVNFTKYHFEHEESLFAKTDYPQAAEHIKEHAKMLAEISNIQKQYKEAPSDELLIKTFLFYEKLFSEHMAKVDPGFTKYLNEAGFP